MTTPEQECFLTASDNIQLEIAKNVINALRSETICFQMDHADLADELHQKNDEIMSLLQKVEDLTARSVIYDAKFRELTMNVNDLVKEVRVAVKLWCEPRRIIVDGTS